MSRKGTGQESCGAASAPTTTAFDRTLRPGGCHSILAFYRFGFRRGIEFTAIDTSKAFSLEQTRYFNHPKHVRFLEDALPDRDGHAKQAPRWSIPFSHHPPFCAGPHHSNMDLFIEQLLPLVGRAGVRLVVSGHEHNFQHSPVDGIHFVITGAAGKLREGTPQHCQEATRAHGLTRGISCW